MMRRTFLLSHKAMKAWMRLKQLRPSPAGSWCRAPMDGFTACPGSLSRIHVQHCTARLQNSMPAELYKNNIQKCAAAVRRTLLLTLFLSACSPAPEPVEDSATFSLDLNEVLGGENTENFLRADSPREFSFPEDHGPHPGFRNEWWYLTGNLQTEAGRRFGYQVTFFSTALNTTSPSTQGWQSPRLWMAHAALSDIENAQHIALERFSRENPGLAGAQSSPFKVWLENWSLQSANANDFPWHLTLEDQSYELTLELSPLKNLVLQGENGLSQKSPETGNASYYYSYTRLLSTGSIELNGESFAVEGSSWLDREWSTSALAQNQSGWDWFSLQFDDGQELMYYQLRDSEGNPHPNSAGNWTDLNAQQTRIQTQDITLEELTNWQAPNGVSYTTEWRMQYQDQSWIIRALLEEQFMDLSLPYWEGAVDIVNPDNGQRLGQGYLEMVRSR